MHQLGPKREALYCTASLAPASACPGILYSNSFILEDIVGCWRIFRKLENPGQTFISPIHYLEKVQEVHAFIKVLCQIFRGKYYYYRKR